MQEPNSRHASLVRSRGRHRGPRPAVLARTPMSVSCVRRANSHAPRSQTLRPVDPMWPTPGSQRRRVLEAAHVFHHHVGGAACRSRHQNLGMQCRAAEPRWWRNVEQMSYRRDCRGQVVVHNGRSKWAKLSPHQARRMDIVPNVQLKLPLLRILRMGAQQLTEEGASRRRRNCNIKLPRNTLTRCGARPATRQFQKKQKGFVLEHGWIMPLPGRFSQRATTHCQKHHRSAIPGGVVSHLARGPFLGSRTHHLCIPCL